MSLKYYYSFLGNHFTPVSQGKQSPDILKAEAFRSMNLIQTIIKINIAKRFRDYSNRTFKNNIIISGLSNQYQEKLSDQKHEIQRFKKFG